MKYRIFAAGLAVTALAFLSGCAGSVNASKSIEFADANKTIAEEVKVDAAQMLEYRLAVANAERDAAKKEDERVEKELRGDVERKLIYQSILDKEVKNGGAK